MPLQADRTSPTTLTVTRRFAADPGRVFAAHTDPALLSRWLTGYDGWSMPVCESDPRPGGVIRYAWANAADPAQSFSLSGLYREVEPPRDGRMGRTVHVERMHMPDPTPESLVTTTFAPDGEGGTILTMVMSLDDEASMDAMLATGMTDGMEVTYARLDAL